MKAKCWARLRRSGLGFGGATQRGMRGVVIGVLNREEAVLAAQQHRFHGAISKLARKAAFNANLLGGIGSSCVARIFSITPSMK